MKKKVLGTSTLYKKTMTKYFILGFFALAFLGFLFAVADQDSPIYGIVLIALSLFLVALAIIVNLMPSESLLYDEEKLMFSLQDKILNKVNIKRSENNE